ncbi:MAG TPA: N-acetyl-gamma-glutamyl-phosphate reductase [Steroidobacteraceae bacterium]|nr:N-acetyl-gamma-glutamyl-phosphate reductase [Steroidobacteraceae bacterium]
MTAAAAATAAGAGSIPALILGGSGYVAGELLRLLAGHPHFTVGGIMSDSQPGEPVGRSFPHLAHLYSGSRFQSKEQILEGLGRLPRWALFCAAPHGAAAPLVDELLSAADRAGTHMRVVDISADYRFADAGAYAAVYGHEHTAPRRLREFTCAVPEHLDRAPTPHVAHPGCFATAILLASVPLLKLDLISPTLFVSGVTGSTGSGRKPIEGTHHPLRHGDLYAYNALAHRHAPEVAACARAATGVAADFAFVPHSGPFTRGIHATVQGLLKSPVDTPTAIAALREFYADCPFVHVLDAAPRVKNVVASNVAHLSAAADGRTIAVMCVLDNLTKGAAGGAVQWMNRLFDLPEHSGLPVSAPGWT